MSWLSRLERDGEPMWCCPYLLAAGLNEPSDLVLDVLVDLDEAGLVETTELDEGVRVRAVHVASTADRLVVKARLMDLLERLMDHRTGESDWWFVDHVVGTLGEDRDLVLDSLVDLDADGLVETAEFEDGVRIRGRLAPRPLADYQRDLADRYYPLAMSVASLWGGRRPAMRDDFVSVAGWILAQCAGRWTVEDADGDGGRLVPLLKESLEKGMSRVFRRSGLEKHASRVDLTNPEDGTEVCPPSLRDEVDRENRDEVEHCLSKAGDEEAMALAMYHVRDMTLKEVGEAFGSSPRWRLTAGAEAARGGWSGRRRENFAAVPQVYLSGVAWRRPRRGDSCPVCDGRQLKPGEYCLYCDAWGMDDQLPRPSNRGDGFSPVTRASWLRDRLAADPSLTTLELMDAWRRLYPRETPLSSKVISGVRVEIRDGVKRKIVAKRRVAGDLERRVAVIRDPRIISETITNRESDRRANRRLAG